MTKKRLCNTRKNLIGTKLIALRKKYNLSQRGLAQKLQEAGYHLDKNVITRIETGKRHIYDIEIKGICEVFQIRAESLLASKEKREETDWQNINQKIGNNLRLFRQQHGFNQQKVADYLQIHQTTYSDYELGKLKIPIVVILKLADFYNIDSKDIIKDIVFDKNHN